MKSTMEKLSSNKVKLDFVVEAARFDEAMEKAYRKNRSRISVPGFRKGKAPRKVIEMQFGEGVFYEDAIDELFPSVYSEAIKEHGIEPVDRPEFDLKTIGSGKDLEFSVEVFVKPDVTLGQYKGVAVHKNHTEVTEDDVKAEIERARERASRYIDIDGRAAKLDDQVTIDYEGECDGEKFEGGSAKDYRLVLGSGNFIPGFEDQLVGAEVGSTVDVNVTFPEDYHAENLKGKKATFKVTVKAIQEKDVPALDDEFAKDVSEFDTLEEYKKDLTEKMTKSAQQRDDYAFENDVIEKVTENATVDIPAAMVEERVDERINEFAMNMRRQGLDMDTYMKYTGQTMRRDARRRLEEGAEKERQDPPGARGASAMRRRSSPTKEEVDAEIEKYAENMGRQARQKFIDSLTDSDQQLLRRRPCKMLKTIEMLKDSAVEPEA